MFVQWARIVRTERPLAALACLAATIITSLSPGQNRASRVLLQRRKLPRRVLDLFRSACLLLDPSWTWMGPSNHVLRLAKVFNV